MASERDLVKVQAPFQPEGGAYGGDGHRHNQTTASIIMNDERFISPAGAFETAKLAFACVSDRLIQLFAWSRMGRRGGGYPRPREVSSTGSKQISPTARDGMRRSSSARRGAARAAMTGRNYLKLRNWPLPFAGQRNLRSNRRSRRRPASRCCAGCGPIACWTGFSETLRERKFRLPWRSFLEFVRQGRIPVNLALPAFLQSYIANLVTAGVRLIPLGQTDGQLAIAELEEAVLAASAEAEKATIDDLGSAAFMVDLASMAHETQYTRLFRS